MYQQQNTIYAPDSVTENLNTGIIYVGSISYGTVPAVLLAISAPTQTVVTTGGQLNQVEGISVYHPGGATSATATSVFSSANPAVFGQTVTFTASITPQSAGSTTPTGTVQFQIDGSNAGGPVNVSSADVSATATLQIAKLAVGTRVVTASYGGDSNFTGSSGMLSGGQVVSKASTHTVVI